MLYKQGGSLNTITEEVVKMGNSSGYLYVPDLTTFAQSTLIITNLSDGQHDPDDTDCSTATEALPALSRADLLIALDSESLRYEAAARAPSATLSASRPHVLLKAADTELSCATVARYSRSAAEYASMARERYVSLPVARNLA